MGEAIPMYNDKNILNVPLRLSFQSTPSYLEVWKVSKMQPYFSTGQFFSILPKYWKDSKYRMMLSEFSFPKMGW